MSTASPVTTAAPISTTPCGVPVPFDAIREPGVYLCNWDGRLLRVPQHSLTPDRRMAINIVGPEPLLVTKISDDADVPLQSARRLAEALRLPVGF